MARTPNNNPHHTRQPGRQRPLLLAAIVLATTGLTLAATLQPAHAQAHRTDSSQPASMAKVVPDNQPMALGDLSELPAVGTPQSEATTQASYFFQYVRNYYGGQCLDGDRNTIPRNGAIVQLWACNGWTNQGWILTQVGGLPTGYYTIRNNYGGQCLDGDRNTIPRNGAIVQLWACNGWTNQVWVWNGTTFRNYYGGQCLDGDRNTIPRNGSKVQLWACNGWTNQGWTLRN
ncbi:hypothetical protein GCM10027280_37860 [Micromonospora polyrhachis]|uniref:Ricin B lectin domain-containing protein n=1 Tax=Micromonospora polyrhachis TaxID=1282883 RepID=A0A7W7SWT1_9ACTN|nr:RICIN domain-containing protein [Micromonospora polyrhachis]MBB4962376.1 hypothetical protein [Micromonospora polyrhachis]